MPHDKPRNAAPATNLEMHRIPIEDSIDLHTFHPRDTKSVVEEYVTAAREAGLREVRVIHGRGRGVQRGIVQAALDAHPFVEEFWDAPDSHLGATVARLRAAGAERGAGPTRATAMGGRRGKAPRLRD